MNNKISFEAILFAIYLFIAPIHQVLRLSNGATINKYLALVIMISIFATNVVKKGKFYFDYKLSQYIIYYLLWCAFSLLWGINHDVSSLVTLISYISLLLVVCSNEWNKKELNLFRNVIMLSSLFFSIQLMASVGEMKRASIVYGKDELEADQNVLASNLILGVIIAIFLFGNIKNQLKNLFYIIVALSVIVGIICTGSRSVLIGVILSLFYLYYVNRKNNFFRKRLNLVFIFIFITILIVLFTSVLHNDLVVGRYIGEKQDDSGRSEILLSYLEVMNDKPISYLIGFGYNNSSIAYAKYFNTLYPLATHNDYISVICNTGIIGLLLFFNLIIYVWKKSKEKDDILGRICLFFMIYMMTNLNVIDKYGFWNCMIFAYIGLGLGTKDEEN